MDGSCVRRRWRALVPVLLVAGSVPVVTGGLAAAPASAASCTKTWAAPLSGDWQDATAWSPAGVPTSSENVCINDPGTYTVTATYYESANSLTVGGSGAAVTLDLNPGFGVTVAASSTIESGSSVNAVTGGTSDLRGKGTLTNKGSITVPTGATLDLGNGSSGFTVVNSGDGSMSDNGTVNVDNSFTDRGPIAVAAGATWLVGRGPNFVHAAGKIANAGSFTALGTNDLTFTQSGGSITGNAISLRGTKLLDSGGTGPILLAYNDVVTGTIPAGQTVSVISGMFIGSGTTLTNDGTLECAGTNGGAGNVLSGGLGITNNGKLAVDGGSACDLDTPLTNAWAGQVAVSGKLFPSYAVVNEGSFTVESGGSFLNLANAATFTNGTTGTVTDDGTFTLTGAGTPGTTFTSDGTIKGTQPIILEDVHLADQAGAGTFLLYSSNTVTGTVPTGQTLAVRGSAAHGRATLSLGGSALTNDGKITLATTQGGKGNSAWLVAGGTGGSLVNNGTLVLIGPPTGVTPAADALVAPITNTASGTILVLTPDAYLGEPDGYGKGVSLTNDGALTFAAGAQMILVGGVTSPVGSSVVLDSSGTFTITLDVKTGAPVPVPAIVQGVYGPDGSIVLGGIFIITTLGTPSGTFGVVNGISVTGDFSLLNFGAKAYKVLITTSSVSVKTAKPFSLTAENFSGTAGQPVTATLATLTSSTSATYKVTVNWGDGTTSPGSFVAATGGGTVTGTHTYASPGTYTVKTTVTSSTGTTRSTTSTATIAAGP